MNKKKIGIIVGGIIGICIVFAGGYYFAKNTGNNKSVSNKVATNQSIQQQKPKDDNKIEGYDLGDTLTKGQFENALKKGQEYKDKNINVHDVNMVMYSSQDFQNNYVSSISVITPYATVIRESAKLAKNYTDINDKNVINQLKNDGLKLNTISCVTTVGGDEMDFAKQDNIVIVVTCKDGSQKTLHATKMSNDIDYESTTNFFPDNPTYKNTIGGEFDITGLKNIKSIDVKIIQPNKNEVNQNFDWNKINQL